MGTSGPGILEVFERRISNEKVAKLRGTARVRFDHLTFPYPIRSKDDKFIKQLKETFAAEGCLDEQHGIPAIIDDSTFQAALDRTLVDIDSLRIASGSQPPKLEFPENIRLECLHGQHRILAAKRYLPTKERWWTVDFYRKGEPEHANLPNRSGDSRN
ncbi:hypothetical protein GMDG_06380 [Pseudogymnoascus destructans 20631-21]|uniref:Uncharacterized protein n=1 Tax=Pseudogymnoascus destructans (strain ATCC MYA-4855 / 20631-21) TaxID=658429 RepID=L8FRZ6_PSED2|nr:hypothetical protein GMDG_06380 [Pseudogymnoascus destructans 20631-21]